MSVMLIEYLKLIDFHESWGMDSLWREKLIKFGIFNECGSHSHFF